MSKVVVVDASSLTGSADVDEANAPAKQFETWVPVNYCATDLKRDVAHYWQLNPSNFELHDEHGNTLTGFTRVASPAAIRQSTITLHRVQQFARVESTSSESLSSSPLADPFSIRDRVFDLFVLFALQNPTRKGQLTLTKRQFRQMLQRTALFPKTRKLEFETNVEIALKRCASTVSDGEAPATLGVVTFGGFLDALVTVARLLFPKTRPEEVAFEKLLREYLIPFYHVEEQIENGCPDWSTMSALVTGSSVSEVTQRFAKPLGDLAETYCATIVNMTKAKSLTFHEFRRFVSDIKPKELRVSSVELCKVFLHCFRRDNSAAGDGVAVPSMIDSISAAEFNGESRVVLPCNDIMTPLGAIACLVMARLAKTKKMTLLVDQNNDPGVIAAQKMQGRMRARILKALLHHIALHLRDRSSVFTVKSASHSLVRQRFLQEFERMHREDGLEDYQHVFIQSIQEEHQPLQQSDKQRCDHTQVKTGTSASVNTSPDASDELAFLDQPSVLLEVPEIVATKSSANEILTAVDGEHSEQKADQHLKQKLYEVLGDTNKADEMYAFLASELLRHAAEKREVDGVRVIEPMLDVWAAAGEKYSQVILQLQDLSAAPARHRADIFARWGMSLEVFAIQVLKHTTTVYEYEALFGVTNPRVFSVSSALWRDISSLFSADLAMESLSLASAKLSRAVDEFQALLGGDAYCSFDPSAASDEEGEEDSDSDDEDGGSLASHGSSAWYEKYLACIFHRANCLVLYGDMLAHGKAVSVDYQLGCVLEEDSDALSSVEASSPPQQTFFFSNQVLAKTSSCGAFYNEARKMYIFLLSHLRRNAASNVGGAGPRYSPSILYRNLGAVQFKLAALVPRGCVVENLLLKASLANATAFHRGSDGVGKDKSLQEDRVANYIRAICSVRQSFFQAEMSPSEHASSLSNDSNPARRGEESIVPFYRFIFAAAFREFATKSSGTLNKTQLSAFNAHIKRAGEVSESTMAWLLTSFDSQSDGLTERGFIRYFCWLGEADPVAFSDILELLTSKYTDTHEASVPLSLPTPRVLQRATSLRPKAFVDNIVRIAHSPSDRALQQQASNIAESVIALSGKLHSDAISELFNTKSPSEIQLEPEVVEILPTRAKVPEELSKFCFPDAMFLSNERTPPRHFDVVLTDIKGSTLYASCLHFVEERDAMDVLALISSADQRGGKTADLPSWISLKDIQQGRCKWRCFLPMCVCILSAMPLFATFRKFLVQTYRLLSSRSDPSAAIRESPEALVFNMLQKVRLPLRPGSQTTFKLGDQLCLVPALTPGSPIFYPTEVEFSILFQCLSADHIVKVYAFLLTEKKVVLCARNKAILTPVAETFRALLHPFEFQHVYIPLLPISLLDFVTAPVPFFMGIGSDVGGTNLGSEGVVVVDLDANDVRVPTNEPMPMLSDAKTKKLVNALRKITSSTPGWAQHGGQILQQAQLQHPSQQSFGQSVKDTFGLLQDTQLTSLPNNYSPSQPTDSEVVALAQMHDDLTEKWADIQGVFTSFAVRLIKDIRKFCSRPPSSPRGRLPSVESEIGASALCNAVEFDKRGFLVMHQGMREFCSHLFQTQLFQRFLDNFDAVTDQLNLQDADQNWRGVRSISSLRRHLADSTGSMLEDPGSRQQPRLIVRAPLPSVQAPPSETGSSPGSRHFDVARYEALLAGEADQVAPSTSASSSLLVPAPESPPRKASAGSTFSSSLNLSESFIDTEDASPSSLVSEARRRLAEKRTHRSTAAPSESPSSAHGMKA